MNKLRGNPELTEKHNPEINMYFSIRQASDSSVNIETFEANGYRAEKGSHMLDAMKHANSMGYASSKNFREPFILIAEDGEQHLVVNPPTCQRWAEEMKKDFAYLLEQLENQR